jgi:hypothetical protein
MEGRGGGEAQGVAKPPQKIPFRPKSFQIFVGGGRGQFLKPFFAAKIKMRVFWCAKT